MSRYVLLLYAGILLHAATVSAQPATVSADRFERFDWVKLSTTSDAGKATYEDGASPICRINKNLFMVRPQCITLKTTFVDPWNERNPDGPKKCGQGQTYYSVTCYEFFGTEVDCDYFAVTDRVYGYVCDMTLDDIGFGLCTKAPGFDENDPKYGLLEANSEYNTQRQDLDELFTEQEVVRKVFDEFNPTPYNGDATVEEKDRKKATCFYDPSLEQHVGIFSMFFDSYTKTIIGDGIDTSGVKDVTLEALIKKLEDQNSAELVEMLNNSAEPRFKRFARNVLGKDGIVDMYKIIKVNLGDLVNLDRVRRGIANDFFVGLFIAFLEDEAETGVLHFQVLGSFQRGLSRLERNDLPPPKGIRTMAERENYKMEVRSAVMTVVMDGIAMLSPAIAITSMETRYMSSDSSSALTDATKAAAAAAAAVQAAGVTAAAAFGIMPPEAAAAAIGQALQAAAALAVSGTATKKELSKTQNYFIETLRLPTASVKIPNTIDVNLNIDASDTTFDGGTGEANAFPQPPPKEANGIGTEIAVSFLTTVSGQSIDVSEFAGVKKESANAMSLTQLQSRTVTINEPIWAEYIFEQIRECFRELCEEGKVAAVQECYEAGLLPTEAPSQFPSSMPTEAPTQYPSKPHSQDPSSMPSSLTGKKKNR